MKRRQAREKGRWKAGPREKENTPKKGGKKGRAGSPLQRCRRTAVCEINAPFPNSWFQGTASPPRPPISMLGGASRALAMRSGHLFRMCFALTFQRSHTSIEMGGVRGRESRPLSSGGVYFANSGLGILYSVFQTFRFYTF